MSGDRVHSSAFYDVELTEAIIGAAMEVHSALGPGLLESVYESCLVYELVQRQLPFARQVEIPIHYKGERVECGLRADLIVDEKVILELKAVERILPVHEAQLLTYLKVTGLRVGLLLNFNVQSLREGIMRRVL